VSPEITEVVNRAMIKLERDHFSIQQTDLALTYMDKAYHVFRAMEFAVLHKELLKNHRDLLKPELVWNIEKGLTLTCEEVAVATTSRSQGYYELMRELEQVDVLICPSSIVAPFDVEQRYPGQERGLSHEYYLDWLAITYVLTPLAVPVLVLPCGMAEEGLPVGIQLVGKPQGEADLLSVAAAIEDSLGEWATVEKELDRLMRNSSDVTFPIAPNCSISGDSNGSY